MNKITTESRYALMKKMAFATLLILTSIIIPSILTSCEIDDAMPGGGSGGGSSASTKNYVGTWTRQVQWAYTDGLRDDTYYLSSGGSGTYKTWDWGDQRYVTTSLTWSNFGGYIMIKRKDTWSTQYSEVMGYLSSGGDAMKIGSYWYYKQ